MHINLKHRNEAKKLPKVVHEYMKKRFRLSPENLELMRCFEYQGQINGRKVRRISIFSPQMAQENHTLIATRQDLEQHPNILLYEGYIDSQSNVYVADRRAPITRPKITQKPSP